MEKFLVDVDGEVVGTGLTTLEAHRLAWKHMTGNAQTVDICDVRDVLNPTVAWVRRNGKWKREPRPVSGGRVDPTT